MFESIFPKPVPFIELANNSWDQIECDSSSSSFERACVCVLLRFAEILKNLLIIGKIGRNERRRDWGHADLREYKERLKKNKTKKTRLELAPSSSDAASPLRLAIVLPLSKRPPVVSFQSFSHIMIKSQNKKTPLHYCLLSLARLCDLAGRLYKETLLVLEAGRGHDVTTQSLVFIKKGIYVTISSNVHQLITCLLALCERIVTWNMRISAV